MGRAEAAKKPSRLGGRRTGLRLLVLVGVPPLPSLMRMFGQYNDGVMVQMATNARFAGPQGASSEMVVTKVRRGRASVVGLLGRAEMGADEALMLRARQVHTFGMKFPIDVIYLDEGLKVIKVQSLKSGRLGPIVWKARWIVEMKDAEAGRRGIGFGWRLEGIEV